MFLTTKTTVASKIPFSQTTPERHEGPHNGVLLMCSTLSTDLVSLKGANKLNENLGVLVDIVFYSN